MNKIDKFAFQIICHMSEKKNSLGILILFFLLISFISVSAQKPLWVQNGVKSLNEHRISKDYTFKSLSKTYEDEINIPATGLTLLKNYISEKYGVNAETITVDSILHPSESSTYKLTFPSPGKQEMSVVYAKLVDEYQTYLDIAGGSFDYEVDQLFAISEKDITPHFDSFEVTRKYNQLPMAMSLVPGLGQIYKGQKAKGFTIMGVEAVMIGSIILTTTQINRYIRYRSDDMENASSWDSKISTYKSIRTASAIVGGALYLYNILDAAFAKGVPHVLIKENNKKSVDISFMPVLTPESTGIGILVTF